MVFPDESPEDAAISAEQVRRSIDQCGYDHNASELGVLTVSIGVAACQDAAESRELVLSKAGSAVYNAKKPGKNRTETYTTKVDAAATHQAG